MISKARQAHLRRVAAAEAHARRDELVAHSTPYELLRAAMGQHIADLKDIQSIEQKIERKRTIIGDYLSWVDGVLAASALPGFEPAEDDILPQALVWLIDVGDFDRALPLAAHFIRFDLSLPERFKRTVATMLAEEVADAALKVRKAGGQFDWLVLQRVDELTADQDMHDQVRAKLKKAIGLMLAYAAATMEDTATDGPAGGKLAAVRAALQQLQRAVELHDKVGVVKDIEALKREEKRLLELPKE